MKHTFLFFVFSLFGWSPVLAKTHCDIQFFESREPEASPQRAKEIITPLCLNGFSVGYSHQLRTPIWSAAHLTRERLRGAYELERSNQFHEEMQLPKSSRVTMDEMRMYGYDRGHLSPNYDMGTLEQQYDSFSLANIALQHRWHNRNLWSDVEKLTRHQVYRYGDAYVVTGVAFLQGRDVANSGVLIPSHFFKAVYLPEFGQAGVYWSKNDDSGHLDVISLSELYQKIGLKVMPALPNYVKNTALYLPTDMSDPEADINLAQAVEAHKPFLERASQFFLELWMMLKSLFV